MLADQLQRGVRSDLGDGVEVVAAEEDTQVDKLVTDIVSKELDGR